MSSTPDPRRFRDQPTAISGIRILDANGGFTQPTRVGFPDGRFVIGDPVRPDDAERFGDPAPEAEAEAEAEAEFDGTGLWMIPGIVDAHLHAAWHAFDAADRAHLDPETTRLEAERALIASLAAGVTGIRDAGGLSADLLETIPSGMRPRVQRSEQAIGRETADAAGGLDRAVESVLATGAPWVKLIATRGVAAPASVALDPMFGAAEVRDAVRRAEAAGARVMVHAWGGAAIDDAIDAGAASIEHGIFLTDEQARRAAEWGLVLVPTLRIYRLVQRMIAEGTLPAVLRARVDEAVAAHPGAVRRARDAGLPIALGTDYGTVEQHGTNRLEFDALVDAGLTPQEALLAATRTGARLLGSGGSGGASGSGGAAKPGDPGDDARGRIVDGAVADAVILRRDPLKPGGLSAPDAVVAVILDGRFFSPEDLAPGDPAPGDAPAPGSDPAPAPGGAPAPENDPARAPGDAPD